MSDDQRGKAHEFIELANEIIQRIEEEREGRWWQSVWSLVTKLESIRRSLVQATKMPGLLIVRNMRGEIEPKVASEWCAYLPKSPRQDGYLIYQFRLLWSDPLTTAGGFTNLESVGRYRNAPPGHEFDSENRYEDLASPDVADKAVRTLRRWVREIEKISPTNDAPDPPKTGKRKRWGKEAAEPEVRKFCKKHPNASRNSIAKETGIPGATVSRTDAYREHKEQRAAKKAGVKPKMRSLSNVEYVAEEGRKHEVLEQLIAQQEADSESSPLDDLGDNPRVDTWQGWTGSKDD